MQKYAFIMYKYAENMHKICKEYAENMDLGQVKLHSRQKLALGISGLVQKDFEEIILQMSRWADCDQLNLQ